jgi:hypothetical protein
VQYKGSTFVVILRGFLLSACFEVDISLLARGTCSSDCLHAGETAGRWFHERPSVESDNRDAASDMLKFS